jgi:hypothetical protein
MREYVNKRKVFSDSHRTLVVERESWENETEVFAPHSSRASYSRMCLHVRGALLLTVCVTSDLQPQEPNAAISLAIV